MNNHVSHEITKKTAIIFNDDRTHDFERLHECKDTEDQKVFLVERTDVRVRVGLTFAQDEEMAIAMVLDGDLLYDREECSTHLKVVLHSDEKRYKDRFAASED